jgi:hypothetical protein
MLEKDKDADLPKFFAWARSRAYSEFESRLKADPSLDPNWTFSDIMQELLTEFRQLQIQQKTSCSDLPDSGKE